MIERVYVVTITGLPVPAALAQTGDVFASIWRRETRGRNRFILTHEPEVLAVTGSGARVVHSALEMK